MDDLEHEILTALLNTENLRLQWKQLVKRIYPKHKKSTKIGPFKAALTRRLKGLVESGILEKNSEGHKKVFYVIPENRRQTVSDELWKDVTQGLRTLESLTNTLLSNQAKIKEWEKTEAEAANKRLEEACRKTREKTQEASIAFSNAIHEHTYKEESRLKPVINSLKVLHKIYCQQVYYKSSVDPAQYYTIIRGNEVLLPIHKKTMKGVDLNLRVFFPKSFE